LNIDRQATLAFNPLEVAADINLKTQDKMQFCQVNSNGPFMDFDECGKSRSAIY